MTETSTTTTSTVSNADQIKPLLKKSSAPLILPGLQYPGLYRIMGVSERRFGVGMMAEPSSLIHAVLNAYYTPYRTGMINGVECSRNAIVDSFRAGLSALIANPISAIDSSSTSTMPVYSLLTAPLFTSDLTLATTQETLNSYRPLRREFLELVSLDIGKDIYLLDVTGELILPSKNTSMYKGRESIVLLYINDMDLNREFYELVSVGEDANATHFLPTNPLIVKLRSKLPC